jgi:ParB-like chromosome segregation protein Spo0J
MTITFPCLNTQLVPSNKVQANDYNPNSVASPEMELLAHSIATDGVTQPVVVIYNQDLDKYIVIDGFHRFTVLTRMFKCPEIPVVVLDKDEKERMAATVRHNRARGKHQVDLMGEMVAKLLKLEWTDSEIAKHLGMSAEEVIRLKQQTGLATLFANQEFSRAWEAAEV